VSYRQLRLFSFESDNEEYGMKKSVFEGLVDKAFLGLEAQYGFKKIETKYIDRGAIVRYRNTTTELCLNYEIGVTPWLEIANLNNLENKSTLGWLLVEHGEQKAPTVAQAFRSSPLSDEQLGVTLQKMGQQVAEQGADLLKGDFAILPKLQERAKKYDAECKRYLASRKSKS
jgi:hypothetical protein